MIALAAALALSLAQGSADVAAVRAHVLPGEEEVAWKRLGWHASLWQGLLEAQAAEKPILLWAMNGHPLGCT